VFAEKAKYYRSKRPDDGGVTRNLVQSNFSDNFAAEDGFKSSQEAASREAVTHHITIPIQSHTSIVIPSQVGTNMERDDLSKNTENGIELSKPCSISTPSESIFCPSQTPECLQLSIHYESTLDSQRSYIGTPMHFQGTEQGLLPLYTDDYDDEIVQLTDAHLGFQTLFGCNDEELYPSSHAFIYTGFV